VKRRGLVLFERWHVLGSMVLEVIFMVVSYELFSAVWR